MSLLSEQATTNGTGQWTGYELDKLLTGQFTAESSSTSKVPH